MMDRGKGMQRAEVMMGSKALIKSFITKHCSDFFVLSLSIETLYLNFSLFCYSVWGMEEKTCWRAQFFLMCYLISHPHTGFLLIKAPQSNSKATLMVGRPKASYIALFILGMKVVVNTNLLMPSFLKSQKNNIKIQLNFSHYFKLRGNSPKCLLLYKEILCSINTYSLPLIYPYIRTKRHNSSSPYCHLIYSTENKPLISWG